MINDSKLKKTGNTLFILIFCAYMFSYFGRNTFSSCIIDMQEAKIIADGFGKTISTAYLIAYGCGQLINGMLVMKMHPKYSMCAGLTVSGICNILMTVIPNQYILLALWAVNGYANSLLWPTVIRVLTEWMNNAERTKGGANISPSIPVGMIVCYFICSVSLKSDWRLAFIVAGSLLVAGGIAWFIIISAMKDKIESKKEEVKTERLNTSSTEIKKGRLTFATFFAYGLGILAVASFLNGALKEAVVSWVPTYLHDSFGFSSSNASLIATFMPVVFVAGPYVAIWVSKKFLHSETKTIGVMYAISFVCNALLFMLGTNKNAAIPAVILLSVSIASMWGVNSQLMTYTPYHFAGLGLSSAVTGTLNAVVFAGSSLFTYLFQSIAEKEGSWNIPVILWAAVGITAAVLCFIFGNISDKKRPDAVKK